MPHPWMHAYSVPERFTPWSRTGVPEAFTRRFPCARSAERPGAGAGGGGVGVGVGAAATATVKVAAELVQPWSVAHPGENTPIAIRYVPFAAVVGTCQVTA